MLISERVNLKLYLPLVLLATIVVSLFTNNVIEVGCVIVVTIGALLNQYFLIKGVEFFTKSATATDSKEIKKLKRKAILFQIMKFLILVLSLSLSVQLMGKRVIIPLSNYIAILLLFAFSFKRDK